MPMIRKGDTIDQGRGLCDARHDAVATYVLDSHNEFERTLTLHTKSAAI